LRHQADGEEGSFILSINNEEIQISKTLVFVDNLFTFGMNEKKLMTGVVQKLSAIAMDEDYYYETQELLQSIEMYVGKILTEFDFSVCMENPPDINDIFKASDLKLFDGSESLPDRICEYVRLYQNLFNKKVFAFLNLKQFLTADELKKIYKFFHYEKLQLILFEGMQKDALEDENTLIIDKDLCII